MQPLRIGFIGAGGNTRLQHLPGFQKLEGVRCEVVCNRSESSSRAVAEEFSIARIAKDWREVVNDPKVDAVCIGTWPNMHAEATIAALEAGKHVLVEARMACNATEAAAMVAAAKARPDLIAQVVPAPFSLDYDATIARLLPSLGSLREIRVRFLNAQNVLPSSLRTWRQDFELSGVNTMALGILYETVQRWLVDRDPAWVSGTARTFTTERPDPAGRMLPVGVPDAVTVLAGFADGAALTMHVSSVASGPPVSEIQIDGEHGCLRMDLLALMLCHSKAGSKDVGVIEPDAGTARGWRVEADFVEGIRNQFPVSLTSFDDGLRYMTFTDLAWQSWTRDGGRIPWMSGV